MVYSNVPKGEQFRVIFATNSQEPGSQGQVDSMTIRISKDGGSWIVPTNSAVFIASGIFSLTLSASEMNADKIDIYATFSTIRNVVACVFTSAKNNNKIKSNIIPFLK